MKTMSFSEDQMSHLTIKRETAGNKLLVNLFMHLSVMVQLSGSLTNLTEFISNNGVQLTTPVNTHLTTGKKSMIRKWSNSMLAVMVMSGE
jgi:hypothetical protein